MCRWMRCTNAGIFIHVLICVIIQPILSTEILSGGGSSRLFQSLVKEKQLFSNIECYHLGSTDAGLLTIEGKLVKG